MFAIDAESARICHGMELSVGLFRASHLSRGYTQRVIVDNAYYITYLVKHVGFDESATSCRDFPAWHSVLVDNLSSLMHGDWFGRRKVPGEFAISGRAGRKRGKPFGSWPIVRSRPYFLMASSCSLKSRKNVADTGRTSAIHCDREIRAWHENPPLASDSKWLL